MSSRPSNEEIDKVKLPAELQALIKNVKGQFYATSNEALDEVMKMTVHVIKSLMLRMYEQDKQITELKKPKAVSKTEPKEPKPKPAPKPKK